MRPLQRNRPKGKNGKMRVGIKHINEAAEALLGMGSGFVDDDMMVPSLTLTVLFLCWPCALQCFHRLHCIDMLAMQH